MRCLAIQKTSSLEPARCCSRLCVKRRMVHSCSAGKCWLVGSGPGSLDLMTIKSIRLLAEAECVVYDDLACQESLSQCKPGTEVVYVGKRGGQPSLKQTEINETLVEKCNTYDNVVRLKGGCVSIFSRAGDETRALAAASVPFELIPGVSSALAAPAAADIPLTDAELGTSVAFFSAHIPDAVPWAGLAPTTVNTVVLLMAGKGFKTTLQLATDAGWPADTPVTVVRGVARDDERVWRTTLGRGAEEIAETALSPCIVVVGQVGQLGLLQQQK
eukprot:jgi/Ulvmu1/8665/UM047_0003.1